MVSDMVGKVPPAGPVQTAPGESLTDAVYRAVKREIVENRLKPDEILVEGALAERFGVSRAPAREALQRLRRTDLVRAVPRLGYVVTPISLRDYDEIFQMRLALEPLATELATARLAAGRVDGADLAQLAAAVAAVVAEEEGGQRGAHLAQVNAEFHREIARLSGNVRLERTVGALLDELERVMHLLSHDREGLAEVRDEHPELLRVMEGGDAAAARELMRAQLEHGYALIRELLISGGLATLGTGAAG